MLGNVSQVIRVQEHTKHWPSRRLWLDGSLDLPSLGDENDVPSGPRRLTSMRIRGSCNPSAVIKRILREDAAGFVEFSVVKSAPHKPN